MNHSEKLLEIYQLSENLNYSHILIENTIIEYLEVIADNCYKQKRSDGQTFATLNNHTAKLCRSPMVGAH